MERVYFAVIISLSTCLCSPVAKSIRYQVTDEASQRLFVADGGTATLFYRYEGPNAVRSFTWQALPMTTVAEFSAITTNAIPPYSVTGDIGQKRTILLITSVNTSLDGNAYLCFVTFPPLLVLPPHLSGRVNLTLKAVPILSIISPSGENVVVTIGRSFPIRINVIQGDAVVNLTKDGDLVQLNGTGKLYEHNIRRVKASTNGTCVAIGDNDVGYHQISFKLSAFYLDNAECSVVANSVVRRTVICTIKSYPPVEEATYSCGNQGVELTWKEIGSADVLGVSKYQAEALITNINVSRYIGKSCSLIATNRNGQINETLREVLLSTPTPSPPPTTEEPASTSTPSEPVINATLPTAPTSSDNTIAIIVGCVAGGVALIALLLLLLCPINLSCRRCLQQKGCSCCFKCYDDCCSEESDEQNQMSSPQKNFDNDNQESVVKLHPSPLYQASSEMTQRAAKGNVGMPEYATISEAM